ncbi:peroxidase 64-like [Lolium rigidum]|uniref:peroxidase 64-like n=1 Tax=Lolium rigidum TaxID=89674 RepID=UPI001F5D8286|nr:peroxidase 64-like [Lolium rigidum]
MELTSTVLARKKARRRSSVELATTSSLPGPGATFDQLKQAFHAVGLSAKDLVVLSGGHTLGFAHCSSFETRIRGFPGGGGGAGVADPALRPSFAAALRRACPANNTAKGAGAWMDPTSAAFDNAYFKMLQTGRGLLASDEALLTHPKTRRMVALYAASQGKFFQAFVSSMLRMSAQNQPGEIRANCRRHN